ncbi:phosphatidylinositol N-acetylglucosaminyltransferase subunit Q-like isoform X2 [Montipora foliosa]|uniref:phosphatidylinositol N-acetylglucosaminyltransferase subunit Q-like isoform X2 n=1 Tax=Montipora foliosa TaxID=591990 RepID=UPI0035F12320
MATTISKKRLRLFFPRHCLSERSGLIIGWRVDKGNISVVVTVTCFSNDWLTFCERFPQLSKENGVDSLSVLGVWINENHDESFSMSDIFASAKEFALSLTEEMVFARLQRNTFVPQLYFLGDDRKPDSCVIVLYKQPTHNRPLKMKTASANTHDFWRQLQCSETKHSTEISKVLILLNRSHSDEGRILSAIKSKAPLKSVNIIDFIFIFVSKLLKNICCLSCFWDSERVAILKDMVKFLSYQSVGVLQLWTRFSQMKALCKCLAQPTRNDKKDLSQTGYSTQRAEKSNAKYGQSVFPLVWFVNIASIMLIDIIFGILIVSWIFQKGYNMHATDFVMEKTNTVAGLLSALLDWLKDAPAGLKLNKHFAEYMSKFFSYHIYLWQIYLSCIEPYLQIITSIIIMSGCFGITFLLSMGSEVLSVITLHIYCFYVYAARLYNFQLKKLIALFRLFTGRRWNVEKNQVDSVPFKADRLFLGTLLFTILLFLLPTTAMYYAVFTVLRLMVLLGKGVINCAVNVINNLPVFPLCLAWVKPDLLPDKEITAETHTSAKKHRCTLRTMGYLSSIVM